MTTHLSACPARITEAVRCECGASPGKSEMQTRIDGLDFSTANNAALSLQSLAEWARTGRVKIVTAGRVDGDLVLRVRT